MRVIDCKCGEVVQAANDDDLVRRLREHIDEHHPDAEINDERVKKIVDEEAYTATDS